MSPGGSEGQGSVTPGVMGGPTGARGLGRSLFRHAPQLQPAPSESTSAWSRGGQRCRRGTSRHTQVERGFLTSPSFCLRLLSHRAYLPGRLLAPLPISVRVKQHAASARLLIDLLPRACPQLHGSSWPPHPLSSVTSDTRSGFGRQWHLFPLGRPCVGAVPPAAPDGNSHAGSSVSAAASARSSRLRCTSAGSTSGTSGPPSPPTLSSGATPRAAAWCSASLRALGRAPPVCPRRGSRSCRWRRTCAARSRRWMWRALCRRR